jgi:D-alanyl-D-alanine dipeptidase
VIGAAGAAWGAGVVETLGEPLKREGDLRAPAGAFRLGRAYAEPLGASWRCVDDPKSAHYNQVFDSAGVTEDWSSAEDMAIAPYRLVVEVEHNPARTPGAGSCIFLHIWDDADTPTAGCTAMAEPALASVIEWLRPGAVYVLLPRAVHDEVAAT